VRPCLDAPLAALADLQHRRRGHQRGPGAALPRDALRQEARGAAGRPGGRPRVRGEVTAPAGGSAYMLPVLFTITLGISWAPFALAVLALAIGVWQARAARLAGDPTGKAVQTGILWAAGSFAAAFLAVRALDGQNLFNLQRPLAVPLHTYGLLIPTAFLA